VTINLVADYYCMIPPARLRAGIPGILTDALIE